MTEKFLLDTNTYALFFIRPKLKQYESLLEQIKISDQINFYISEITSLEIHSVIGKYRRGNSLQKQVCKRRILFPDDSVSDCKNIWYQPKRKKLKRKAYRDIMKLLSDIESGNGEIRARKLGLDEESFKEGTALLTKYGDRYNFGSHDALIAGTLIAHTRKSKENITLITSDKGFKKVLQEESIPFYDPNKIE